MHDVVLEPMSAIKDLFSPTDPNALIAIWHSLEFRKDGLPLCKIYLNPGARGRDSTRSLVVAALDRLGEALSRRWGRLDVLVGNAGMLGPLSPLHLW